MTFRWSIALALLMPCLLSQQAVAAEIYTFGKKSNGMRYIKNIERSPKKVAEEEAKAAQTKASSKVPPPPAPMSPRNQQPVYNIPPPPVDSRRLEILDTPI